MEQLYLKIALTMEKVLKTTKYLYNCNPDEFSNKPYIEALHYKIQKTIELVAKLYDINYKTRDIQRISDVINARKFNENLINELTGRNYG